MTEKADFAKAFENTDENVDFSIGEEIALVKIHQRAIPVSGWINGASDEDMSCSTKGGNQASVQVARLR